ncbi:MAG: reverse transcriptase domain-containing protein [Candidatus Methanomethyliaceae archaeon]
MAKAPRSLSTSHNIDHKLLLRIMRRDIADSSILNLVRMWLKAGVVENGATSFSKTGTPQGGTISPLLANIYLNEVDWILEAAQVQFVRYADDILVFAQRGRDAIQADELLKTAINSLKLELSLEKTRTVRLVEQDTENGRVIPEVDYLGVTIQGWFRKRDGKWGFGLKCTPEATKSFKEAVKELTPKTHTLSLAALVERLNPKIRGKSSYWAQAAKAVNFYREAQGECRCSIALLAQQGARLDTYVRKRIRRCRLPQRGGSKTYRRANMLSIIYTHERFIDAGLVYTERIIRDAASGQAVTDRDFLSVINRRRAREKAQKQRSKAHDIGYWAKRKTAYDRAQERRRRFESK